MLVPQLFNTPEVYYFQLVASTVTDIGLYWIPLERPEHQVKVVMRITLNDPLVDLQDSVLAVYGYSDYDAIPLAITYFKALYGHPPLHPWFPYSPEQSTNCCSESLTLVPFILYADSMTPVVEKAQHEPH